MTAIVGVLCRDGVVIATDSSATFVAGQRPTIEQPTEKLTIVDSRIVLAGTGSVGLGQRFKYTLEQACAAGVFNSHEIDAARSLSRLALEDWGWSHAPLGQYSALVAFVGRGRPHLCEFDLDTFQPEFKDESIWYCSMGGGQPITDPFLGFIREVFWETGRPTVQEGIFAATWTIDHVIRINAGGVNGPARMAVLEQGGRCVSRQNADHRRS